MLADSRHFTKQYVWYILICRDGSERTTREDPRSMATSKKRKKPEGKARKSGRRDEESPEKVVRDSFTMPKDEHGRLKALKARCLKGGVAVKKSELLRAGIQTLDTMSDVQLLKLMQKLERVKTGRPAKRKG
jgi:hypothetical protein